MLPFLRIALASGLVFGLVASGIDRVEEQRDAVEELAADRGAASAGGVLLAWLADLDAPSPPADTPAWVVTAAPPTPVPATDYAAVVDARRRDRAWRAAALVPPTVDRPSLVALEGDRFLVLPARGATGADPAAPPLDREGLAAEFERLRREAARAEAELRAAELHARLAGASAETRAAVEELRAEAEAARARGDTTGAAAIDAVRALTEGAAGAMEQAAREAPRVVTEGDRTTVVTGSVTVDVPAVVIPGLPSGPWGAGVKVPMVTIDLPALTVPPTSIPVPPTPPPLPPGDWTRTVAWWPAIEADITARTGIPLQAGGEPPGGRLVLPAFRLAGEPVWSLPTGPAAAAVGAFDATGFLLLLAALGWVGVEVGMVRRRRSQERARGQARDEVLQRLSHELRTPAAAVRSLVDALDRDQSQSPEERRQFLGLVRSEAERLAAGIDRLLQAARGDTELRIDPVPMDLAEWADGVAARWSSRLPGLARVGDGPLPVTADPDRLDEAVDALLDNAIKHGGPGVTLGVSAGRFWVEDDGLGVDPADRARILRKFERVEGRVNDAGGHGLGLWAVGEVARAHGGRLSVEGRSRFVVTLGTPR